MNKSVVRAYKKREEFKQIYLALVELGMERKDTKHIYKKTNIEELESIIHSLHRKKAREVHPDLHRFDKIYWTERLQRLNYARERANKLNRGHTREYEDAMAYAEGGL